MLKDLGGQAKFEPDVEWLSSPDNLTVDTARGDAFYAERRKYWPSLPAELCSKIQAPGEPPPGTP